MCQTSVSLMPCCMMMMIINCFCGMVDQWKAFSHISSQDHCQRSSPSKITDMLQAGFEPAQKLSSGFVEWSCVVVITTTHQSLSGTKFQWLNMSRPIISLSKIAHHTIMQSPIQPKKQDNRQSSGVEVGGNREMGVVKF